MIPSQRALFDLPDDVAFLNCAYMAPQLRSVTEAGQRAMAAKSAPWKILPDDFFDASERARSLFAGILGGSADDIAWAPSASYGLAIAAANLPIAPGQHVLVLADQFPSNVYVWHAAAERSGGHVRTVVREGTGAWTEAVLEALQESTAICAVPHVHWTDGSRVDLVAVGARAREVGAALVVDATQSLGAFPLDLAAIQPDFLVCAGYKWLMGPYSTAFLHVASRWQEGTPIEWNWLNRERSEDFARLVDYRKTYQPGARRFDVGERSNFALTPMVIAALEQVSAWGVEAIASTLQEMTDQIGRRAGALGLLIPRKEDRGPHILGIHFPMGPPKGLIEALAAQNVHVSLRGDAIRISPHVYNTPEDLDRLFLALNSALRGDRPSPG